MSAQVVDGGSVLRVKCDFRCFDASTPYDNRCDQSKRGTAFLLQLNGVPVIVTAHHVVSNAVTVTVTSPTLGDGEARTLKLIGCNPHLDIAILVGPPEIMRLTPFLPQRSSNLKPRHAVTCVGFALGTMRTHTTTGTVSGRNEFPHNRIQTDTTVNPGNSGGPMLDAETKRVVGVVTSGMNNADATNFFTPMDEAYYAIRRIVTRYRESGSTLGVDMGYHLSAVVRSVNADACLGARGGALVAATHPDIGLAEGDVILAVADPQGTMVDVNAHMRVSAPSVWAYDAVDFRSLMDAMTPLQPETRWKMLVRRSRGMEQGEMLVDVLVGEQRMRSRAMFPTAARRVRDLWRTRDPDAERVARVGGERCDKKILPPPVDCARLAAYDHARGVREPLCVARRGGPRGCDRVRTRRGARDALRRDAGGRGPRDARDRPDRGRARRRVARGRGGGGAAHVRRASGGRRASPWAARDPSWRARRGRRRRRATRGGGTTRGTISGTTGGTISGTTGGCRAGGRTGATGGGRTGATGGATTGGAISRATTGGAISRARLDEKRSHVRRGDVARVLPPDGHAPTLATVAGDGVEADATTRAAAVQRRRANRKRPVRDARRDGARAAPDPHGVQVRVAQLVCARADDRVDSRVDAVRDEA